MRAAILDAYGPPDVLVVRDVPEPPPPGPGEVTVDVHATSVNPVDYKFRQGHYRRVVRYALPRVLGLDLSGVVSAVGPGVTRWQVGDAVYGSPQHDLPGTYAERTRVRAADLAAKPAALSHAEAASLPLVFETAWQALVDAGGLQAGEHCFVQAGSGGVGSIAIQIAKHRGATVSTTCSAANADLVTSLGADRVVDYRTEAFDAVLSDVDVCLDTIGVDSVRRARAVMRRGGRIVGITPNIPEHVTRWGPVLGFVALAGSLGTTVVGSALAGVRTRFLTLSPSGDTLAHAAALLDQGALRPVIDRVVPLDDIAEAHRYVETRRARGKVVIGIR
ncbi:MAG: NADP-dependent oxidoreductase [Alphaproteobacteria bacterium]|nr:NADP-dependent oxidoreductase [Alphaproteobacteria bacterium]